MCKIFKDFHCYLHSTIAVAVEMSSVASAQLNHPSFPNLELKEKLGCVIPAMTKSNSKSTESKLGLTQF